MEFDFDTVRQRLTTNIQTAIGDNFQVPFSVINILVRAISQEIDFVALYMEALYRETRWNLARNQSSIATQVAALGYKPGQTKAAEAVLTASNLGGSEIRIPQFDQYSTNDGSYNFVAIRDHTISSDAPNIFVVEGTKIDITHSVNVVPTTLLYENFTIPNPNRSIDSSVFSLIKTSDANPEPYNLVNNIFNEVNLDNRNYEIIFLDNGTTIQVLIATSQVSQGDVFQLSYVQTSGRLPRPIRATTINRVTENPKRDTNSDFITISVSNPRPSTLGADPETIEEIRANAPIAFSDIQRYVTVEDYTRAFLELGIGDFVRVVGEQQNLGLDNVPLLINNLESSSIIRVYAVRKIEEGLTVVSYAPETSFGANEDQINRLKGASDTLVFDTVNIIRFVFIVFVLYKPGVSIPDVQRGIISDLKSVYSITSTNNLSTLLTRIDQSDYVNIIDSVEGVERHITRLQCVKELTISSVTFTLGTAQSLDFTNISKSLVEIWVTQFVGEVYTERQLGTIEYQVSQTGFSSGNFVKNTEYPSTTFPATLASVFDFDTGIFNPSFSFREF